MHNVMVMYDKFAFICVFLYMYRAGSCMMLGYIALVCVCVCVSDVH